MSQSREEIKERRRLYRIKNKEHIKQYRLMNRVKLREQEREYRKKRNEQYMNLKYQGAVDIVYKKYNNSCWLCKTKEHLNIHHKDGKGFNTHKYKANNSLKNLVILCSGCHKRVHTLIKVYMEGQRNG